MRVMGHALIFDSGVGGLSVVAEIRKRLPDLQLSYAADDIFRPYGEKSEAQLKARLPRLLWELTETTQPDIVVMACNTASTTALSEVRSALKIPVIGVVPAIKPAATASRTKTIAVLGTPGTVQRRYVDDLINEFASDCHVLLQGSVNLVDIAEKHFPLLRNELKASVTQSVQWIDSGDAIARRVDHVLKGLKFKPARSGPDIALLVGPETTPARIRTFNDFGFERVVALMPR